ncbi:MAG: hypothetical protein IRZ05_19660 [Micromonosporaceae bacterium]|jgi:hypothetical protein|nr:hypothetical protein [Micromonosporaceae bacterium]
MRNALPPLLFLLAGVLVGGAVSLHRQGAARGVTGVVGLLAVAALAGGILWLLPGEA